MTLKLRFSLLLSLLGGGFLIAALVLRGLERAEMESVLAHARKARALLLNHWVDVTSRSLPQLASDTAQSDELGVLLAAPDSSALRAKLETGLAAAGVHALWVLRKDGTLGFQAGAPAALPAPLSPNELARFPSETAQPRFFAEPAGGLLEVCVRRIQPSRADGLEWLMVARRWDDAQLRALETLTEARVTLHAAHENVPAATGAARVELLRPLNDWRGHPLRILRVEAQASEIEQALHADWREAAVFITLGLLAIAAMALALQRWVLGPLGRITESLTTNQLHGLVGDKSELGRIAQLVVDSFEQRQALVREGELRTRTQVALEGSEEALRRQLEDRARLGRDLHDGIIQSLYAAGMGLAGIRALLRPDQAAAADRLEQTRAALTETIHDVRNFIIGLEPEALKLQTFGQAVGALLEGMRTLGPFRSSVEIDEALAHRLTLAQRVHALQIAREAVSNAVRHGHAKSIHIALRPRGKLVEFEITDDGTGFDARQPSPEAKGGLANFGQRARELGADLEVRSEPGGGTRVKLVFSLLIL